MLLRTRYAPAVRLLSKSAPLLQTTPKVTSQYLKQLSKRTPTLSEPSKSLIRSFSTTMSSQASNDHLSASTLFDMSGLKCVVSGGATGIGLMMTQALVANGATVYIVGRRKEKLDNAVSHYSKPPGKIIPLVADVTSRDSINDLVKKLTELEPDGIHLLVNNAGVAEEQSVKLDPSKYDPSDAVSLSQALLRADQSMWDKTFASNVTSIFFLSTSLLPLLAKGTSTRKGYSSSIVNTSSISGILKTSGAGQFAYAASKAAAIHLTKVLAATFKDVKVRVNTIAPGIFPSEMTAGDSDEKNKSVLKGMGDSLPSKRTGEDQDIASAILYLAGPASCFVNGQIVHPDGGNLLTSPSTL